MINLKIPLFFQQGLDNEGRSTAILLPPFELCCMFPLFEGSHLHTAQEKMTSLTIKMPLSLKQGLVQLGNQQQTTIGVVARQAFAKYLKDNGMLIESLRKEDI